MTNAARLLDALDQSWPAAEYANAGTLRVGRGCGGGMRVGSATAITDGPVAAADMAKARAINKGWAQASVFRALADSRFATSLQAHGLNAQAPTEILSIPIAQLIDVPVPPLTVFPIWPPLAIQRQLWAAAGIGPERMDVMKRCALPRTALLGRMKDHAAAVGYVAASGSVAAIHAIDVIPGMRRKGLGRWMLRAAAFWGAEHGCDELALAVRADNHPAKELYRAMGLEPSGSYLYYV